MALVASSRSTGVAGTSCRAFDRPVVHTRPTTSSRQRSVQVHAKGKGKNKAGRLAPPQLMQQQARQQVQVPPIDPDNEEFVIFVRAVSGPMQQWQNVSIVKGGSQANTLVQIMKTEWGRTLFSRVLIQNIGQSLYKERDTLVRQIRQSVKKGMEGTGNQLLAGMLTVPTSDFQFAFKIRDKSDAMDAARPTNLTIIPPEAQITLQPLDAARRFFAPEKWAGLLGGQ